MPSYRVTMAVGALVAGVPASEAMPAAAALAAERAVVEAKDIRIVAGAPCVVVRFTAADDGEASAVAGHVALGMRRVASVYDVGVTRRDGGRWTPVR